MKKIIAYVPCSGCGQLIPSPDGLHIEGTLRDGYHGSILGEENSDFFFCSMDCLYAFVGSKGLSQVPEVASDLPEINEDRRQEARKEDPEPKESPEEETPIPAPRAIKKVTRRTEAPEPVKARKLFQGEEPLGYNLPKGPPNTGKPPSELRQFTDPPSKDLRAMEEELREKLKASRPPEQ
jgi:hypothetical protein